MSGQERAARVLRNLEAVHLDTLASNIAWARNVTISQILGGDRLRGPSNARAELCYALRYHSEREWSYPEIGRLLELDHSTIMSAVAKHAERLAAPLARCGASAPADPSRCA